MKQLLLNKIKSANKIVIIGFAESGKTTLSSTIENMFPGSINIIHTDEFIKMTNWKEAINYLLNRISITNSPMLVEGVQCYRLLRTGLREDIFIPDLIIDTSQGVIHQPERTAKQLSFQKTLTTIYNDWWSMAWKHPKMKNVEVITIDIFES